MQSERRYSYIYVIRKDSKSPAAIKAQRTATASAIILPDLYKKEFDPLVLAEETVEEVRHIVSWPTIILNNDFAGKFFADRGRIGRVLLNVLTNAIIYSPAADHVNVCVKGDKDFITIRVKR